MTAYFPRKALLALLAAVLLIVGGPRSADAQPDAPLIVLPFDGSKPKGLRELTAEILTDDGFEVITEKVTPKVDSKSHPDRFAKAAYAHQALAIIHAYTSMGKKGWRTSFTIRDGTTGKVVGKTAVRAAWYQGLRKAYQKSLASRLRTLLKKCKPAAGDPAPPEPEPKSKNSKQAQSPTSPSPKKADTEEKGEATDKDSSAATEEEEGAPDTADALALGFGPAVTRRSWKVKNAVVGQNNGPILLSHTAPLFGLHASMRVYPASFFTSGIVRHIGIEADYSRSLQGETDVSNITEDEDDKLRDTTNQSLYAGLHIRIPVRPLTLGIFGGYAVNSIMVDGSKELVAVPDVNLSTIRAGLSGQLAAGDSTAISLALAYRVVLGLGESSGELESEQWFPDASGQGFDFRMEFRQMLSPSFGVSLGGGLEYYFLDFDVSPAQIEATDAPVAKGARDSYTRVDLNAVLLFSE